MTKVFISHATADRSVVTRDVIDLLRDHKIDVWFAEDDIATARQWERSILEGLKACDWFLLALTPRAVESEWIKDEVHWAVKERPGRIVPVLIEDCDLRAIHIRLPRIQYVDFRDVNDDARRRLLSCWDIEYRPAARFHPRFRPVGDRYLIGEPLSARDFLKEYLGKDTVLKRNVLIKCDAYNHYAGDPRRNPVMTEAHATASLVHPAIPRVFDLADDPEFGTYSVLEHVAGIPLRDRMNRDTPLPAADVVELIVNLCDAVQYANDHDVIHRNIKPGSIIVGDNQRPFLTNFIVAKIRDRPEERGNGVGTLMYMAPEQFDDQTDVDCRVDVWGLGVLLYELLTGKLPFHRESLHQGMSEMMKSIREQQPVPLRVCNPSISKSLDDTCLRCLEKDRTQRFSTASDLAKALNSWRGRKGRLWGWR